MSNARKLADNLPTDGQLGNRNLVINGAMQVAQRGTSSTGLGATSGYYTVDRFNPNFNATAGRLTMTQETITDLPGFTKCIKYACTTADTSTAAGEYFIQTHAIEGQNLQHINKGTSSAKKLTLSFYVKGNAAATYVCELQDGNSREIAQTFSVTTSWNRVVLTFDGDTNSGGTIANSNATGLAINLWLHGGSTFNSGNVADLNTSWSSAGSGGVRAAGADSFFDSTSRTFFITGMQLEVGPQSTPFEHEPYATTLRKCQRYFERRGTSVSGWEFIADAGQLTSASSYQCAVRFNEQMRAAPTMSYVGTLSNFKIIRSAAIYDITSMTASDNTNGRTLLLYGNCSNTGGSGGEQVRIQTIQPNHYLYFDAEL